MRKYFTAHVPLETESAHFSPATSCARGASGRDGTSHRPSYLQLSTCCRATWASCGRFCCAASESIKVSGFCGGAMDELLWEYMITTVGVCDGDATRLAVQSDPRFDRRQPTDLEEPRVYRCADDEEDDDDVGTLHVSGEDWDASLLSRLPDARPQYHALPPMTCRKQG